MISVDPDPFTLRELVWMAEGHAKNQWVHTAHLICVLANQNRGKEDKLVTFEDVYPFAKNKKQREPDAFDKWLAQTSWEKLSHDQGGERDRHQI